MQQSISPNIASRTGQWQQWKRVFTVIGMALWFLLLVFTVISAYGGYADPEIRSWPAILAMCFPGVIIATVVFTIVLCIARLKIGALCGIVAVLICFPAILTYSPLNIFHSTTSIDDKEFKIMTWNVLWWYPYTDKNAIVSPNPDVQAVLDASPDILVLQESTLIKSETNGITQEQFDEFNKRYKYQYRNNSNDILTIYSRYPFLCNPETSTLGHNGYARYTLDIQGHRLTLFNVHLQNFNINRNDATLYLQLLNGVPETSEVRDAKNVLIYKLSEANRLRAQQAKELRKIIDNVEGNVMVCGDFNDIPGSFSVRTIRGEDLKDAYADAGLGPGITFHSNKMFFRIDHILYRGDFTATDAKRLKVGQSDHYPILATFRWKNDKNSQSTK